MNRDTNPLGGHVTCNAYHCSVKKIILTIHALLTASIQFDISPFDCRVAVIDSSLVTMPCCTLEKFVAHGMGAINATYTKIRKRGKHHDYLNKHGFRQWKSAYGIRPIVAYEGWMYIHRKASSSKIRLVHLFWTLHWMKTYQTEDNLARTFRTTSKTYREKVRVVLKLLAKTMPKVVSSVQCQAFLKSTPFSVSHIR